jgi:hypothetical protein
MPEFMPEDELYLQVFQLFQGRGGHSNDKEVFFLGGLNIGKGVYRA